MIVEAIAFCHGVIAAVLVWMAARALGRRTADASQYHNAQVEVDSILDLLRDKFGEGWVNQSLAEFSLAATVERAIRWSRYNDEQNERMTLELKERRAYEEFLRGLAALDRSDAPSFEAWQWDRDQENKS